MRRSALVWCVSAILVAGCDGSSGNVTPAAVAPSATTVVGSARPTPEVVGSTYRFLSKGYSVDAPSGWQAQPDSVFDKVNSQFPTDAFYAPDVTDKVQPNLSITCQKTRPDQVTTVQYRDAYGALLKQIANVDVTPRLVTVDGSPAYAFDYTQEIATQATSVDKTDVVFAAGNCRWLVTLAMPTGQRAMYAPVFDQALSSIKLLPLPGTSTPAG